MKFVLITKDREIVKATEGAFQIDDELIVTPDWAAGLQSAKDADLIFVDLIATLTVPHKVAGYERFAEAKMADPDVSAVPLVLIAKPDDYELDFMVGWPNFVFAHLRRPLNYKLFRRATTWV
ncbi:MAG: hypothetical protein JNM34_07010 [Chthonomonadaceae bacterium]|nr:hypothetical protein [Chthonomonadaceae bacterium]